MLRSFSVFVFAVANMMAATPSIGQVSANGRLTVDRSEIWGSATLFEGTSVATGSATGDLSLRNGVRMQLGSQSQAVIGQHNAVLEKGSSQVSARDAFEVRARGLRITAEAGTRMVVALNSTNGVDVTALTGKARVNDKAGMLIAAIPQGRSAAFWLPQQAGATGVTRTGCLLYKDNHFIFRDDATSEVIELSGSGFGPNTGNRVRITGVPAAGNPAVAIATGVMNVSDIALQSSGGCITIAATLDARTEAPATPAPAATATAPAKPAASAPSSLPEKHGMSGGAKAAIIIGVIGGGAGGAFAAIGGKKSSTSQ